MPSVEYFQAIVLTAFAEISEQPLSDAMLDHPIQDTGIDSLRLGDAILLFEKRAELILTDTMLETLSECETLRSLSQALARIAAEA